jgi:predicted AlkP superfamily pyrophosphatase or phosphodiesterase
MMKHRTIALSLASLLSFSAVAQKPALPVATKPKLIVAIAVDQFRYDYTTRFRSRYTSGLARMLSQGAVYVDAHQDHYPTVTATGHATYLTGSVPATSGIIGNEWFDRKSGKMITSVEDAATKIVGLDSAGVGSSPHNLIVSALGDELKIADRGTSKVIGISMKDRAAILPAGRMADAAYWVDGTTGSAISSTWYMQQLPDWMVRFNDQKIALKNVGASWYALGQSEGSKPLMTMPKKVDKTYFSQWEETPWANDMLEQLAETIITNEQLGKHDATDILTISFSANDHLGHAVGPDDPAVEDMSVRTDQTIGRLIDFAVKQAGGEKNVLVTLTADHGVSPVPEINVDRKMPGGRLDKNEYINTVKNALQKKFGEGNWVIATQESGFYLNDDLIAAKKLKHSAVEDEVAATVMALPYVARVYTRTQLLKHEAAASPIDEYMIRGFFAERGPDVMVALKPYYLFGKSGTSHGSPYDYDSHVPLIFWGAGIPHGVYTQQVGISDVAPTLAAVLHIETPSGTVGHVLKEVAKPFNEEEKMTVSKPASRR